MGLGGNGLGSRTPSSQINTENHTEPQHQAASVHTPSTPPWEICPRRTTDLREASFASVCVCVCVCVHEQGWVHKYDSADDEPAQILVSFFHMLMKVSEPPRHPPPPSVLFSQGNALWDIIKMLFFSVFSFFFLLTKINNWSESNLWSEEA